MRTESEILQAIADLEPSLRSESKSDRDMAKITIDTLNWILGRPSVCEIGLKLLRQIRHSNKAATN